MKSGSMVCVRGQALSLVVRICIFPILLVLCFTLPAGSRLSGEDYVHFTGDAQHFDYNGDYLDGVLIQIYYDGALVGETTTDSEGKYTISNLLLLPSDSDPNYYDLYATKDGYAPVHRTYTVYWASPDDDIYVDFYLYLSASLRGKVTDSVSGEGISGVLVELYEYTWTIDYSTTTDENGDYAFIDIEPSSSYKIRTSSSGYDTLVQNRPLAENDDLTHNLSMSATGTLQGQVTEGTSGFPIGFATIYLDLNPPDGSYEYSESIDSSGDYLLGGITLGEYTVTCVSDGFISQSQVVNFSNPDPVTRDWSLLQPGKLQGRVVDDSTKLGLEGVEVILDKDTADGVIDYQTTTDAFGFYKMVDLAVNDFTLKARHPAYNTWEGPLIVEDGSHKIKTIQLGMTETGAQNFDIYVQVLGAYTNLAVPHIPVDFTARQGTALVDSGTLFTDDRGAVVFRGMLPGDYQFTVNQGLGASPVWKSFTPNNTPNLNGDHMISFYLEPFKHAMKVWVKPPYDWMYEYPMYQANYWVEVAGVDPDDTDRVVVPARTAVSGEDGRAEFKGLPAIPWRITVRRPGFVPRTAIVYPDAAGNLPAEFAVSRPAFTPDSRIDYAFNVPPYNNLGEAGNDGYLELVGFNDSNTEGFVDSFDFLCAEDEAVFRGTTRFYGVRDAWAGPYKLAVDQVITRHQPYAPGGVYAVQQVDFHVSHPQMNIEIIEGKVETMERDLHLEKAKIQGILMVADDIGGPDNRPLYMPRPNTTIEIKLHENVQDWLPGQYHTITLTTDENGEFSTELLPAVYGLVLPDSEMQEYWGEGAIYMNRNDEYPYEYRIGWPYYQLWPYSDDSGTNDYYRAWGLSMNSGDDVYLKLLVRKNDVRVVTYAQLQNDPLQWRIIWQNSQNLSDPLKVNYSSLLHDDKTGLLVDGDNELEGSLRLTEAWTHECLFTNVPPGDYTFNLGDNRFTRTNNEDDFTVSIYPLNAPGYLPDWSNGEPDFDDEWDPPVLPLEPRLLGWNYYDFISDGAVDVSYYYWDYSEENPEYSPVVHSSPSYFKLDNLYFLYQGGVVSGATEFYAGACWGPDAEHMTCGWLKIENGVVRIGGPLLSPVSTPSLAYNLTVKSRKRDTGSFGKKEEEVSGVTFNFEGETAVHTTPATFNSRTETMVVEKNLQNNRWYWRETKINIDPASYTEQVPVIHSNILVERAMSMEGYVLDGGSSDPLGRVSVEVVTAKGEAFQDYYSQNSITGRTIRRTSSSSSDLGKFNFENLSAGVGDYYLIINENGYRPLRYRVEVAANEVPNDGGGSNFVKNVGNISLTALKPSIVNTGWSIDRKGYFLPGVKISQDQSAATEALTLKWEARAKPEHVQYSLKQFDNSDGSKNPDRAIDFYDSISDVLLIDARFIDTDNKGEKSPEALTVFDGNAAADQKYPENQLALPDPNNGRLVRKWAEDLIKKVDYWDKLKPGSIFQSRYRNPAAAGTPPEVSVAGEIKLNDLPPGPFNPYLVVLTEKGGANYLKLDIPAADKLVGVRMPTWMSFAANAMGTIANAQSTGGELLEKMPEKLAEKVPRDKFAALPAFTGKIEKDGDNDGFVNYEYSLAVNWEEGMKTPGSGLLGIAPGVLGANFNAEAGIGFQGKGGKLSFAIGGEIEKTDIDLNKYTPGILRKIGVEGKVTSVKGKAKTIRTTVYDQSIPYDLELKQMVGTDMDAYLRLNLEKFTGKIPYVGPVLTVLDKANVMRFYGRVDAGIDLTSVTTWRTRDPDRLVFNTLSTGSGGYTYTTVGDGPATENNVKRRNMFGGYHKPNSADSKFELGFNFGVGLEGTGLGDKLHASAKLVLKGDDNAGLSGKPSVKIVPNLSSNWPPIKRVYGKMAAEVSGKLDLWVTQVEKNWSMDLLKFDHQFGTNPYMQVIPMQIIVKETGLEDFGPVDFTGHEPEVIADFLPIGDFSASGNSAGSGDLLLYTDTYYNDQTEKNLMTLELAVSDGNSAWASTLRITEESAILDSSIVQMSDGRWLAAWVVMQDDEIDQILPVTEIHAAYSTDAAATSWSTPETVTSLYGVAEELQLHVSGSFCGAIWWETEEGIGSTQIAMMGAAFNASQNTWGDKVTIRSSSESTDYLDFDATGSGVNGTEPVHIGYLASWGSSYFRTFGPDGTSNWYWISDQDSTALAMFHSPSGQQYAVRVSADGGVFLLKFDPDNDEYTEISTASVAEDLPVKGLKAIYLDHATDPVILLVWVSGDLYSSIFYQFIDPVDGMALTEPLEMTAFTRGGYSNLKLTPGAAQSAVVYAKFKSSGGVKESVRVFHLDYAHGHDVGNDRDVDGLNDIGELPIVDILVDDAFTDISGVSDLDDYDNDGYSNGDEISEGTDPTNPDHFPTPSGLHIYATIARAAEVDATPGYFTVYRGSDDSAQVALTVNYTVDSGASTASEAVDFEALSGTITLAAGVNSAEIEIVPISDDTIEGGETVTIQLQTGNGYVLTPPTSATLLIDDSYFHTWLVDKFGLQDAMVDTISGPTRDGERDGLMVLLEYALYTDPTVADTVEKPYIGILDNGNGDQFLTITYRRNIRALDLVYTTEVSTDLNTWESGPLVTEVLSREGEGDYEYVTVRDRVAMSADSERFIRLHVSQGE